MKAVFESNPLATELLVFSDGICFINDRVGKSNAHNYSKQTGLKAELVVKETEEKPKKTK